MSEKIPQPDTISVNFEAAIENCWRKKTLESIESLPGIDTPLKPLFLAVWNGQHEEIQPLYTKIGQSPDPRISVLIQSPNILLASLFTLSFCRENDVIVEKLLSISPSPSPNMKSFINSDVCKGALGWGFWSCENVRIWSLMLRHGYKTADQYRTTLSSMLHHVIHMKRPTGFEIMSVLLEYGAKPEVYYLHGIMRHYDTRCMDLFWKYIPRDELKDSRLLHETILWEKIDIMFWLLDVAKMDINLIPSEGPWDDLQEFRAPYDPNGKPEVNGTPLHEAVIHNRKKIVSILLKRGAKKDIKNEAGKTAYEVAKEKNNWYLMARLMVA